MPSYVILKEDKITAAMRKTVMQVGREFWVVMQRRAVWQVMLYTMISSITFNVYIASKSNANFVWLGLSTAQNQILNIMEAIIFAVGLVAGTSTNIVYIYACRVMSFLLLWMTCLHSRDPDSCTHTHTMTRIYCLPLYILTNGT
jgi:hypothetical protein